VQSRPPPIKPTFHPDGRPQTKTSGVFSLGEGISVELVWMTPELARWILANANSANVRKLKSNQLRRLRAEFNRVGFALTGETIIFNQVGKLLDGQHRLTALAQVGVSGWVVVVHGVKDGARWNIDTAQQGRSVSDIIGGYDIKSEKAVAALARLCFLYEVTPDPSFTTIVGRGAASAAMEAIGAEDFSKWIVPRADILLAMHRAGRSCMSRAVLGGANYIAFAPAVSALASYGTPHAADALGASMEYMAGLGEVSGLTRGDARAALLRYRGFAGSNAKKVSTYREHLVAVCTSAWNSWMLRRPVERVQAPKTWAAKVVTYADTLNMNLPSDS